MEEKKSDLAEKMDMMNKLLERQIKSASLGMTFLRGILNAIGWVVGIAILLSITAMLITRFSDTPILGDIINFLKTAATKPR